jgi:hypothetical protein
LADPKDSYSVKLLQPKGEEKERMRKYLAGYRVCHSGFGPDFRGLLCGSRYHYPYVLTHLTHGMKMMGKYKSKEAAEKAMAGMKKCHA